jgi:hypothetical protein
MPRGVPRNTEGITKMEGVRRSLSHLGNDAMPLEIQKYLKSEFGIDMDTSMISNYKSAVKTAGKSAVIRRPAAATVAPVAAAATSSDAGGITLEEIRAVKAVVDKFGADKVLKLAGVLSK